MIQVTWSRFTPASTVASLFRLRSALVHLANTRDFSLLCGYSMGSFYRDASIEDIARQHTHIVTASGEAAAVA